MHVFLTKILDTEQINDNIDIKIKNERMKMNIKNLVFDNILSIKDKFDVFIFDVYGVIWSGNEIYKNIPETLQILKNEGKIIYILSNGTQLSAEWEKSYTKKGLIKGIHYDNVITSGEVTHNFLLNKKLKFKNNTNPTKFYTIGLMRNKSLFEGTIYTQVENPKDADFFYMGIPVLTEEQIKTLPKNFYDKFFLSKINEDGSDKQYSITTPEFFKSELEKMKELNLPAVNANPDLGAFKNDIINNSTRYGLAQGSIVEYYKNIGGEIFEIGKPHSIVYNYIFKQLEINGISVNKNRIAMIGDTVRTDIRGANNAGIKAVLSVGTGISASKISKNGKIDFDALNKLYTDEKGVADYLIKSVADDNVNTNKFLILKKEKGR